MKKALLSFLVLFCCVVADAQNFNCFSTGVVRYFTNSNGYLRGMRIDSVRGSGSDTIYYPYHSPRGTYGCDNRGALDSNGGSWLGGKVIKEPDGTFLFDNMWQDTVVVKTQALVGDSWIFFDDTTHISYRATMVAFDTMTVLGSIDSVKKITIEADSAGVVNTMDPVNNFQIILSKHFGFVQVFDLYTFPYHRPDSIHINVLFFDYYFDLVFGNLPTVGGDGGCGTTYSNPVDTSHLIFKLIPFRNPSKMEINSFDIGDVFESTDNAYEDGFEYLASAVRVDTILSKTSTPYSVLYTIASRNWTTTNILGTVTTSGSYWVSSLAVDTGLMFSFQKLPEEWGAGYFFYYFPLQTVVYPGCETAVYVYDRDNIDYVSSQVELEDHTGDPDVYMFGYRSTSYGIGYGQLGYHYRDYSLFGNGDDQGYVYIDKGATVCGGFSPVPVTGLTEIYKPISVDIFPNPVQSRLNILASAMITTISITNLIGETIYSYEYNANKAEIDVSSLPSGVYFIKINGTEVRKFLKE